MEMEMEKHWAGSTWLGAGALGLEAGALGSRAGAFGRRSKALVSLPPNEVDVLNILCCAPVLFFENHLLTA
jgi:hypothetical protein